MDQSNAQFWIYSTTDDRFALAGSTVFVQPDMVHFNLNLLWNIFLMLLLFVLLLHYQKAVCMVKLHAERALIE